MTSTIDAFVRGSAGPQASRRRWLGPVLAGLVLLLLGLLALQPAETGVAFDPENPGPTGLRALVDTLRGLDVEVTLTDDPAQAAAADSVLVPPLGWPREVVDDLVAQGRRVVAAVPPDDEAVPNPLGVAGIGLVDLEPDCALLADVGNLRTSQWLGWQPDTATDVAERCITADATAWLHRLEVDDGELVSLSTMAPLTNERFGDSDAALAGVRLLAPTGDERVAVLLAPPGAPPPTLFDLVDRRWFDAAWLTLAVLLVLALARGRRLGRPVEEELPVRVPSGELARAIGDLRHRAGHHDRAADVLRQRTLGDARRRLGLPPSTPPDAVLDELHAHDVAVPAGAAVALTGPLPTDAEGLVSTTRALAQLRATLRGEHAATPTTTAIATDDEGSP